MYDKPKVTIDLEEYNYLKSLESGQELEHARKRVEIINTLFGLESQRLYSAIKDCEETYKCEISVMTIGMDRNSYVEIKFKS